MMRLTALLGAAWLLAGMAGCASVGGALEGASDPNAPTPREAVADAEAAAAESPATPAAPYVPSPDSNLRPAGKPAIVARVESVQFPAWVERGGMRAAIKAGWALYTDDRVSTGSSGRVEVSVVGQGRMRLAGDSELRFAPNVPVLNLDAAPLLATLERGTAVLSVLRGDFGGTSVRVGRGLEATLAGGQVVLQARAEDDQLALVDGAVLVGGPKLNAGTMSQPSTMLRVPHRGRAGRVSPAPPERIAQWISPTEPSPAQPVLRAEGTWDVSLNSGYDLKKLETMACRIQNRGIPGEISAIREPGKQVWYRVLVRRFATREDAVRFLGTARSLGATQPWVLLPST